MLRASCAWLGAAESINDRTISLFSRRHVGFIPEPYAAPWVATAEARFLDALNGIKERGSLLID
jgi:hypothetical protein